MSVTVCPRKFGRGVCGAVLDLSTVDGRLVEHCPACARFTRGVCADCPRPVAGKRGWARRCAIHRKAELLATWARHRERHREALRRKAKHRMRRPAVLARNIATTKAWRQANPERVRARLKWYRTRRILRELRAARRAA